MKRADLLLGRPLATDEERGQSLGPLAGVPVLGLDALASAAYGPEAALTVLHAAGAAGVAAMLPITASIEALLLLLYLSYRQTVAAYPGGGGAYTVAHDNLGPTTGLLAASALALDYVLNAAVAVSAGVGAVVSAVPALLPHRLSLGLGLLALLTLINLRGVRSTATALALPTALFIASLAAVMAIGAGKTVAAGGAPAPVDRPPHLAGSAAALGWWLVLRAFSSGCTAMTGVEAVSNGVPLFRPPPVRHARRTLALIVAVLAALLAGEAALCRAYRIGATLPDSPAFESVLSQLARAVVGRGWLYYATLGSVFALLCLSANTSFAGFPRLARVLAADGYLPGGFARRGRRLVYARGILLLALPAAALLLAFGGVTDRLIPLFAIGAFLAFTLSQLGMVGHWRRRRAEIAQGAPSPERARERRRALHKLALNAVGAAGTGATLVVVGVSKFVEGAWITLLVIPLVLLGLRAAGRRHARQLRERALAAPLALGPSAPPPLVLIPIERIDRVSRKALAFALQISRDVQAVQILTEDPDEQPDLAARWPAMVQAPARAAGLTPPELFVLRAKYRRLLDPFLEHLRRVCATHAGRTIAVLIPERADRRWYRLPLRSRRATLLRTMLLLHGADQVVIVEVPWHGGGEA